MLKKTSKIILSSYKSKVKRYYEYNSKLLAKPDALLFDVKLNILKKFLDKNYTVLDAGCGNGNFSIAIKNDVRYLHGVDFTFEILKLFSDRLQNQSITNINLLNGDLTGIPIKNNQLDLIFSFSALYYVKEIDNVIKEFYRILKPGGRVILEFANIYNLAAWHSLLRYDCPQYFMRPSIIDEVINNAGFLIETKRLFHLIPSFFQRGWIKKFLNGHKNNISMNEFISTIPILKKFAFKIIIIAKKD